MDTFLTVEDLQFLNEEVEEKENICKWIKTNDAYTTIQDSEIYDKLPPGVYKVYFDRAINDYKAVEIELKFDNIYKFNDSIINSLIKEITDFWSKKELYQKYHILQKRGILLEGQPGTSKTTTTNLIIQQIIDNKGIVFLVNSSDDLASLTYFLLNRVRKIEIDTPIVTIIEDIDQIVEEMGSEKILLDFLDGKCSINNHLVILTSNNTTSLSTALLRPGRVDTRIVLNVPTEHVRREYFKNLGVTDNLDDYVKLTEGFNFAQLKEVFIRTIILEKNLKQVVEQISKPLLSKNYLINSKNIKL